MDKVVVLWEKTAMARRPRIHYPGALYHVITRGNRRQGVFLDERDFERFLTYLSECKSRFAFRLYASGAISEAIVKVEDDLEEDKSLEKAVSLMRMKLVEGRKREYRIYDA